MADFVIRNALLLDGTGAPRRNGGLAVADGRIVAVGDDLPAARETVDASGLALAPGIIDGHTHYDAQLTWDPYVDPSTSLGVTTIVIGNCGFTIAPCRPRDRDITMRHLTHVEGMSLDALRAGINWNFESFPQYMDALEAGGLVPNVAAFVGHSSVRTFVLGDEASSRAATATEVEAMAAIVREAMAVGAVGFATSTNEPHNGEGGVPMPSRLADAHEMRTLVGAMGAAGRGVFMLTKGAVTSVPFLEEIAAETDRPVVIAALLHNTKNPTKTFDDIAAINAARARGRRLTAQVSPCPLTMEFTLLSPYPFEDVTAWRPAMAAHDTEALKALYADRDFREAVKADLVRSVGKRLFNSEWQKLAVREVAHEKNRHFEGQPLDRLAAADGKHPLDWLLDLSLSEDLGTLFIAQLLNSDQDSVGRMLAEPNTHVALSDAGAHLTFMCDADYGLHLLGHWSRDLGVLSLEQAVRKLSGQPADLFGITDRGRLMPGMAADLLLFDPASVGRGEKRRVNDLPAAASRLTTAPRGIHGVWVNGVRIVDETGLRRSEARPGHLLRSFGPT